MEGLWGVIWSWIAKWGAGLATGLGGMLITYLLLPLIKEYGKKAFDWVVGYVKLRRAVGDIKKEAAAKEENLDKVLKDENASDEEIEQSQKDRLDGW